MSESPTRGAERVDLASLIESSDDAIVGITQTGVISSYNRAAARLYGHPMGQLIGSAVDVLIPPAYRADEVALLRRVAAGEDVQAYRAERLRGDGTQLIVSMRLTPIRDSTGAVVGAAAIAHRVGEPEKPGRSADRALANGDDVHWAQEVQDRRMQTDMDAEYARERVQVQEAQDRFQVRMGHERAQERVQVQEAQDRFQVVMGDERARERVQVHEAQDRFQTRMGEERAQERVQVQEAQDRFQAVMATGRAQAQNDRRHLQAQLHQSQRLEVLGQLAGGVAHDFNNILAVILNYAAFVVEELDGADADLQAASRDVGQIQRAAERAADLTHQLLAFARREVVQPQVLDLNKVVTDVEQLLRRTIGTDVLLQTHLAAGLWPVLADAGQVEQVLVNLAVNARDAMGAGGTLSIDTANVLIDADADMLLPAGRHVRLRVNDTGTGMPAEIVDHVFEPFFTTKSEGAGTGLGLSTVYGIVAQAEGTISIHSLPGAGTTFTILIPVTDEATPPVGEASPYERVPAGETVLVVEDQEALRDVTERIFTRSGYHVITAADGTEAVSLAARHPGEIHLLLTDVVMPNMLGKEVAERVRQLRPDIEVLFMSGYAQPILASQGRLDRDVNLIEKPFTASAIIEKAGRILNGHFEGFRTVRPGDADAAAPATG